MCRVCVVCRVCVCARTEHRFPVQESGFDTSAEKITCVQTVIALQTIRRSISHCKGQCAETRSCSSKGNKWNNLTKEPQGRETQRHGERDHMTPNRATSVKASELDVSRIFRVSAGHYFPDKFLWFEVFCGRWRYDRHCGSVPRPSLRVKELSFDPPLLRFQSEISSRKVNS